MWFLYVNCKSHILPCLIKIYHCFFQHAYSPPHEDNIICVTKYPKCDNMHREYNREHCSLRSLLWYREFMVVQWLRQLFACSLCSFGNFPGIRSIKADVSELNVGFYTSDGGEIPKRTQTTFWTWRKSKNYQLFACLPLWRPNFDSMPVHMMFWWTEWHWARYFFRYFHFLLSASLHKHTPIHASPVLYNLGSWQHHYITQFKKTCGHLHESNSKRCEIAWTQSTIHKCSSSLLGSKNGQ